MPQASYIPQKTQAGCCRDASQGTRGTCMEILPKAFTVSRGILRGFNIKVSDVFLNSLKLQAPKNKSQRNPNLQIPMLGFLSTSSSSFIRFGDLKRPHPPLHSTPIPKFAV